MQKIWVCSILFFYKMGPFQTPTHTYGHFYGGQEAHSFLSPPQIFSELGRENNIVLLGHRTFIKDPHPFPRGSILIASKSNAKSSPSPRWRRCGRSLIPLGNPHTPPSLLLFRTCLKWCIHKRAECAVCGTVRAIPLSNPQNPDAH